MPTSHFNPPCVNPPRFDHSIVQGHIVKGSILTLFTILNKGVHNHKLFYNFIILKNYCDHSKMKMAI